MGFSVVAAAAMLGVAIFICIEVITGSVFPTVEDVDLSYATLAERKIDIYQTNVNITSVTTTAYGLNYNHSINITNDGSTTLDISKCMVLINGTNYQFNCTVDYLYPAKYALFNVTNLPGAGDKTAKIVTHNGIEDYYTYTI